MIKQITVAECDICGTTQKAQPETFRNETNYKLPSGWMASKVNKPFCMCPRCWGKTDEGGQNMMRLYTTRGERQLSLLPGAKQKGESHANRGMELENELKVMHALYNRRGLARVEKNFCPTQPLKDARFARIIGKAIVDFTGVTAGGRFVAFDAKDCVESRIELNRLAEHQAEYLMDVFALGGMAFVLVRFKRRDVYKIPIDIWTDAEMFHKWGTIIERVDGWKPKNRASLSVTDMRPEWTVNGVDWMRAVSG